MDITLGSDEKENSIMFAKNLVGTGEDSHLTTPIRLDVSKPHVITICGKRGEGKSYSLGVIAEGIAGAPENIRNKLCSIIIDTQGVFWTIKNPNDKDIPILREWGMNSKGFDVDVYVPQGQLASFQESGVTFDGTFSFLPSDLSFEDWMNVFSIDIRDSEAIVLQQAFSDSKYNIDDMIENVKNVSGFEKEKHSVVSMLESSKRWGIFGDSGVPDLLLPGKISVLDFSQTPQNVRALILAILSRKIFSERVKARRKEELSLIEFQESESIPIPWILIDEAHNFAPVDGKAVSSDIINKIVKEGRQPGVSLVLATQRPMKLHSDVLAQCDIIISHRMTSKADLDSLKSIMQTYLLYDIVKYINELPKLKGAAIALDDNAERIFKIRVKPRQSWHAGSSAHI